MFQKECANDTEQGCLLEPGLGISSDDQDEWLEETVWYGMRMWHVIFLAIGAVLSFVILLCCCFKFRIPRTKQEIEGDYIRRRIMRKFRKRLKAIQNQELDEMDLKKALDKIRTELKSDTESLQQSDVLSGATLSSAGAINPVTGSTYRRASQIQIEISLEDLRIQSMGLGARIALAFGRFFRRSDKPPSPQEESGNDNNLPEGSDKPTTALLPKQDKDTNKKAETDTSSEKKTKGNKKPGEATTSTAPDKPNDSAKKKEKSGTKKVDDKPVPTATTTITTEKETKKPPKNGKKEKASTSDKSTPANKDPVKEASKKDSKPSTEKKAESQAKK